MTTPHSENICVPILSEDRLVGSLGRLARLASS